VEDLSAKARNCILLCLPVPPKRSFADSELPYDFLKDTDRNGRDRRVLRAGAMLYSRPVQGGGGSSDGEAPAPKVFFGKSAAMQTLRRQLNDVAGVDIPILIQGESGTGKGILAREIHRRSPWRDGPFLALNCASIPAELLESELFGCEPGAFSGAVAARSGWVQAAAGGTLLLDEIADMSLPLQAKILHLLQDSRYSRIGGQEELRVEARILCATQRDLEREAAEGRFRLDLLYRINAVTFRTPRLAERREDIPELANHFLRLYSARYGTKPRPLSATMLGLLVEHDWPGNIRELENLMRSYTVLDTDETIARGLGAQLPAHNESLARETSLKGLSRQARRELERRLIEGALQSANWNRKAAARMLNISYRSLFYKIRAAGLPPKNAARRRASDRARSNEPCGSEEP
jgi:two-component system response regulator AtoC